MTFTVDEFASGLEALAAFYRSHPDTPVPDFGCPGARVYAEIDVERLIDALVLNPDRIEPTNYGACEFVWDFGAGVTLRRRVKADLVTEATDDPFQPRIRSVHELQDEAKQALAAKWSAAFAGPTCAECRNPGDLDADQRCPSCAPLGVSS